MIYNLKNNSLLQLPSVILEQMSQEENGRFNLKGSGVKYMKCEE
jgi:hypothetical protein